MSLAPGGRNRASLGAALAVADHHRLALRGFEQSRAAPQIKHLGGTAEDRGDDLGGAGQTSGFGGGDRLAADKPGRGELIEEVLQRDRDHQCGGIAPVHRKPARVHDLEQRAERNTELAMGRNPVGLPTTLMAVVAGRGEGLEVGAQPNRGRVGKACLDLRRPVTQAPHRQAGPFPCPAFLGIELAGFLQLVDLGRDNLEDPATQYTQLTGTVVQRLGHEVRLCLVEDLRCDPLTRQSVQRMSDDNRLLHIELPGGQRCAHQLPSPVQRLGQRQVPTMPTAITARVLRQQRRGVASTLGSSRIVCHRHGLQPHRCESCFQPGQLHQERPLLLRRQEHRVARGHLIERGLDHRGTGKQRMTLRLD